MREKPALNEQPISPGDIHVGWSTDTRKKDRLWQIATDAAGHVPPMYALCALMMDVRDELKTAIAELRGINGLLQSMERSSRNEPDQDFVNRFNRQGRQLANLIERFKPLAKAKARRKPRKAKR